MNRYENITIIDADVGEDERNALLERIESQISRQNGTLIEFDDWGMKKLAYEIRKKRQGQYVRTDFCGNGEIVDAIERMLRHDQRVLRFMTVRLEQNVDPEALKARHVEEEQPAEQTGSQEPETGTDETLPAGGESEQSEIETAETEESTTARE
ncbi:MAG: 30S ribosomal protein S6 [Desulfobacteraceae bacterium]|nr:30S ribosomal protein S6 [Desulfobacteraceae bacterium]